MSQRSDRKCESNSATPDNKITEAKSKDNKDSLFGDTESDSYVTPKKNESIVPPKTDVDGKDDKKLIGNVAAKPFQPSVFGGGEKKATFSKVAPPGKAVGKLQV